jgi:HAD superfamily hydrolase (TIGR01509 family)
MTLQLPPGTFKAYLFDCDGTIVDSMPLHYLAWKQALAEWNCEFPEDLFYSWGGTPVREIVANLNARNGLAIPTEQLARRKEGLYFDSLPRLQAVPEVLEVIAQNWALGAARLPMGVVSGSTRESVTKSLELLGLLDRFDTLVCAGDYTRSKPDPEPFLTAAARLNVAPADCLVFEDTDMGVQAATAAGMTSIKILQPWERKKVLSCQ